MKKINFADQAIIRLKQFDEDVEFMDAVKSCVDAQKAACRDNFDAVFKKSSAALFEVSDEALRQKIGSKNDIDGIGTHRDITNAVVFNFSAIAGSVLRSDLAAMRRKIDRFVLEKVQGLFEQGEEISIWNSGNFWYPPGGFMAWHTNRKLPGWRLYINFAEEPGKSFFKYRDPDTGEIVTCIDETWNFRLFKINQEKPLWHAVYSDTNRFSLGYLVNTKAAVKKCYAGMYERGYSECRKEECREGYEWLTSHFPEEYGNYRHRVRALSTQNRLFWKIVKTVEEKEMIFKVKQLIGSIAKSKAH